MEQDRGAGNGSRRGRSAWVASRLDLQNLAMLIVRSFVDEFLPDVARAAVGPGKAMGGKRR